MIDMDELNVARITRVGDVIVNVELADKEWLDAQADDPWFYFVAYVLSDEPDPDNTPEIGGRYDKKAKKFVQPEEVK